jgi:hypothetical protein
MPSDLTRWTQRGTLRPEHAQLLDAHGIEMAAIAESVGGMDALSPQRQALLSDYCRLGVGLSLISGRMLTKIDTAEVGELASRLATLATARARILSLIGLDPERNEIDLDTYLREKAQAPEAAS